MILFNHRFDLKSTGPGLGLINKVCRGIEKKLNGRASCSNRKAQVRNLPSLPGGTPVVVNTEVQGFTRGIYLITYRVKLVAWTRNTRMTSDGQSGVNYPVVSKIIRG